MFTGRTLVGELYKADAGIHLINCFISQSTLWLSIKRTIVSDTGRFPGMHCAVSTRSPWWSFCHSNAPTPQGTQGSLPPRNHLPSIHLYSESRVAWQCSSRILATCLIYWFSNVAHTIWPPTHDWLESITGNFKTESTNWNGFMSRRPRMASA